MKKWLLGLTVLSLFLVSVGAGFCQAPAKAKATPVVKTAPAATKAAHVKVVPAKRATKHTVKAATTKKVVKHTAKHAAKHAAKPTAKGLAKPAAMKTPKHTAKAAPAKK